MNSQRNQHEFITNALTRECDVTTASQPPRRQKLVTLQSLRDKIAARLAATREIVTALDIAAKTKQSDDHSEIWLLARRIELCGKPNNHYVARNLPSQHSKSTYSTIGSFWQCGSKLCPSCLSRHAQRNRRKLRHSMSQQEVKHGERFSFVTFTITNPETSLSASRDIVNYAWTLFRKRKFCVSLVRGGCKSEEFTLTRSGFHYHLHCIFLSKWFSYQELRRIWTECVEAAFEKAGLTLVVKNKDGLLRVVVKPIVTREGSIQEVCKYITKADSWVKMSQQNLLEVAMIRRWHRMFEMFGSFSARQLEDSSANDDPAHHSPIVHTESISDASSHTKVYWRDHVKIGSELPVYLSILEKRIEYERESSLARMSQLFPDAIIQTADELGIV